MASIWLKPYIPNKLVRMHTLVLLIGGIWFVCVLADIRKSHRTKLVCAQILYKKTSKKKTIPEEYAVCVCHDQNGKEYLMKTRNVFGGIDAQVKDELLVAVNPSNYRSYQFLEQNCELIKKCSDNEMNEIAQNIDRYIGLDDD